MGLSFVGGELIGVGLVVGEDDFREDFGCGIDYGLIERQLGVFLQWLTGGDHDGTILVVMLLLTVFFLQNFI